MTEQTTLTALLSDDQAADYLHLSRSLLRRWRSTKRGPQYIRIGCKIRYRLPDLDAWLAGQLFAPGTALRSS